MVSLALICRAILSFLVVDYDILRPSALIPNSVARSMKHGTRYTISHNARQSELGAIDHLFVFGAGYTGQRLCQLARKELGNNLQISVSCRDHHKADMLIERNICDNAYIFDTDSGLGDQGQSALALATHLVLTVPPTAIFDRDPLLAFHRGLLRRSSHLRWVGYLSTTGVYGDHQGNWVNEETHPVNPSRRAAVRLAAEREWLDLIDDEANLVAGLPLSAPIGTRHETVCFSVNVFRLAGIYGPQRSAIDTVLKGEAQVIQSGESRPRTGENSSAAAFQAVEPQHRAAAAAAAATTTTTAPSPSQVAWVSRAHVDDICGALLAGMRRHEQQQQQQQQQRRREPSPSKEGVRAPPRAAVFNVADLEPAPREQVLNYAAELIGEARFEHGVQGTRGAVVFRDPGRRGSERRTRATRENKRVCGEKLRQEFSYEFRYPTYKAGLRAVADVQLHGDWPGPQGAA